MNNLDRHAGFFLSDEVKKKQKEPTTDFILFSCIQYGS